MSEMLTELMKRLREHIPIKNIIPKRFSPFYHKTFVTFFEYFRFIFQGGIKVKELKKRHEIVQRFRKIHGNIECTHSEVEMLHIANEILSIPMELDGDIIECGCYKGGSSCKLSIVAKMVNRKLIICDSFKGLPAPQSYDIVHKNYDGRITTYREGQYYGTKEEVISNLKKFGEISNVEIIKGYFEDTLKNLKDRKFVLIFIDVDLYDSVLCCIENLWPSLQNACLFFTHEARDPLTVKAFTDETWWRSKFNIKPPILHGEKFGLSYGKPYLAYVKKSNFC